MVDFDAFVAALHSAVVGAGEQVRRRNLEILAGYFEDPDTALAMMRGGAAPTAGAAPAAPGAESAAPPADGGTGGVTGYEAISAFDLRGPGGGRGGRGTPAGDVEPLVPRMIALSYPRETADGPVAHTVYAPLLALVPHQGLVLHEAKMRLRFAISLDDARSPGLQVAPATAATPAESVMEVEIIIKDEGPGRGLLDVVLGYERAMRAEIPG